MNASYEIGPFRLDANARVLTKDGAPTPLGPRAVAVLTALVERPNEFVESCRAFGIAEHSGADHQ